MKRIQIASLQKRILSSLIDLALIAGLTCLFYFCVFVKAVENVQHFDNLYQTIQVEKNNSGLYIKDTNTTYLEKHPKAGEGELAPIIKTFYVDFLNKKYPSDDPKKQITEYWYYVHVLYLDDTKGLYKDEEIVYPEIRLFDWDGDTYKHKPATTQEQADDFFRLNFGTATSELMLTNPIHNALATITFSKMRAVLYASLVGTIIPCFIIPISLKNGKTIGKLAMKLVVLTDDGYEYKRYKHIFRYLSFYIFEVFGGVVTIGLTLILTTSLVLFSKKRRALHDFISFSVVADETYSVFYKDEKEEAEYELKSKEKLVA